MIYTYQQYRALLQHLIFISNPTQAIELHTSRKRFPSLLYMFFFNLNLAKMLIYIQIHVYVFFSMSIFSCILLNFNFVVIMCHTLHNQNIALQHVFACVFLELNTMKMMFNKHRKRNVSVQSV